MSFLRVVPIVEGHGDYQAIRTLLHRIWTELLGGKHVDVVCPIRQPRSKLIQKDGLHKAVDLATSKLGHAGPPDDPALVLVLIDAHDDCPARLGPKLLAVAKEKRPDTDVCCVVANVEYETWFVAAAESLHDYLNLGPHDVVPEAPEETGAGKAWIARRFKGTKYSETVDQPAMTARFDLSACRRRSPSFDKLCRELQKRLHRPAAAAETTTS